MPRMPALRRSAPTVRFMTFDTLTTGVRALEWALRVRKSSFVHGLMTRRVALATFVDLTDFAVFTVFFDTLAIIEILRLNAAHISMRCGENKAKDGIGYIWYHSGERGFMPVATYSHRYDECLERAIGSEIAVDPIASIRRRNEIGEAS